MRPITHHITQHNAIFDAQLINLFKNSFKSGLIAVGIRDNRNEII